MSGKSCFSSVEAAAPYTASDGFEPRHENANQANELDRQSRPSGTGSKFISRFVARLAVLLAASVVALPVSAREKSRDLETFFRGHLTATGKFRNYQDGSTRGVRVDIQGAPDGAAFKLIEDTAYSDGERHRWVWKFSKVAEGRNIGQRAGLIGQAKVHAYGNKIEIAYRAHVPMKDGKTRDLNFKETFVFTQSGMADYRLGVSLAFIRVGEAHLTVRKRPQ